MTPYYQDDSVTLYHGDCREVISGLCVVADVLITDPPYCMLDVPWDYHDIFYDVIQKLATVMAKKSIVVFFGRGDSAYRHNIELSKHDFVLSEEIVWDKRYVSSPLNAIPRQHEMCYIRTRGKSIKKIFVPYDQLPVIDACKLNEDIRRIRQGLIGKNRDEILKYLNNCEFKLREYCGGSGLSANRKLSKRLKEIGSIRAIQDGVRIKSIVTIPNDHYGRYHPAMKPIALMCLLIQLCCDHEDVIIDPFAGSGTTGIAAKQLGRHCILIEQDEHYCEIAANRIAEIQKQPDLFTQKNKEVSNV